MIPGCSRHINLNCINEIDLSSNWNYKDNAELIQKYYSKGVQMGATFADYIERKKTGMNMVKRIILRKCSGCNVTSHNIRPEIVILCEAKSKVWEDTCYPKKGQGAKC